MARDMVERREHGGGAVWFWAPVLVILFVGGAFSVGAYFHGEHDLSVIESIGVGFGGVAGLILGLFAAFFGLILGAGALAFSLFLVASPILCVILLFLLLRKNKEARALRASPELASLDRADQAAR